MQFRFSVKLNSVKRNRSFRYYLWWQHTHGCLWNRTKLLPSTSHQGHLVVAGGNAWSYLPLLWQWASIPSSVDWSRYTKRLNQCRPALCSTSSFSPIHALSVNYSTFCKVWHLFPKYCRYGIKHYIINQSINQSFHISINLVMIMLKQEVQFAFCENLVTIRIRLWF